GRLCLFRTSVLAQAAERLEPGEPRPWWRVLDLCGDERPTRSIGHLKRILLTSPPGPPREIRALQPPALPARPAADAERPHVSIILPTRDKSDLLERAITSVTERTVSAATYEVVIVDNGSSTGPSLDFLASVQDRPGFRVLRDQGAFNFSRIVNDGAAAARGDVLVFLNNDCEVASENWLDCLAGFASLPDVGAVGALLLYRDSHIQHAGVTLGLGGEAGHRDRNMPSSNHLGHLFRLRAVHEVSAVTGACLAVERAKFERVGGFDPAFAVAFNDVDFCLRLRECGYQNLLAPQVVLQHLESASRGKDTGLKRRARFEDEAMRFRERWGALIHDDPFHHPLFSTTRFNDWLE
ncbi:MAG: glycosyl transferase family 2, partial [Enterovirga sp.]|nr:glycosyl transferase family 2 [Enterovirga sp.]